MKKSICLLLALLLGAALCGCEPSASNAVYAMDEEMQLQVWGEDCKAVMRELEQALAGQEAYWGAANPDAAPDETILEATEALAERTGGALDPWLGNVLEAYGFYDQVYRIPTEDELSAALENGRADLSAVIRGYAGDKCVEALNKYKVTRAFLDLGGGVQTYGEKPDGEPWVIGIPGPDGKTIQYGVNFGQ